MTRVNPDPVVSFVVPTKNAARTITACLESMRQHLDSTVEIVVVDNGSTDGTAEGAERLADRLVHQGPERSAQRNHGARVSRGEYLVFIDADMLVDDRTAGEVVAALEADPTLSAAVIPELAFGSGYLARCRGLEKRLYLGDETVEAPRAFRRTAFFELGGFDETLFGGEDWDLVDRARAAGFRIGRLTSPVLHDEGRINLKTTFKKKRYYGTSLARYLELHPSSGRSKLARLSLLRRPGILVRSIHLVPGLVLLKLVEGSGLALGIRAGRRSFR